MKLIIDIIFMVLWNILLAFVYCTPNIDSFGILKYFPIWLMGFSTGGLVMLYLIKYENSKNKDKYIDYENQYNNVKKVSPSQMEKPKTPSKQK